MALLEGLGLLARSGKIFYITFISSQKNDAYIHFESVGCCLGLFRPCQERDR
jgi:hypothetical protein